MFRNQRDLSQLSPTLALTLGVKYFAQKNFTQAERFFLRVWEDDELASTHEHINAGLMLHEVYHQRGQFKKARDYFTTAHKLLSFNKDKPDEHEDEEYSEHSEGSITRLSCGFTSSCGRRG